MAHGDLHVCSLVYILLCVRLCLTFAEDVLTASSDNSNSIKLSCDDGQQLNLSNVNWSPFTSIDADFESKCNIETTKQLFIKLCKEKKQCNLPIDYSRECLDKARLSIHYFCSTQPPQQTHLEAEEVECPPCPAEVLKTMEIMEIALIIIVAILFVTNVIQISCFLYITRKKPPVAEPTPGGLRLSQATTARRLPPEYADTLATVPVDHFTTGVIAKKVEGTKKGTRKAMGAKPPETQHHFSLLVATSHGPAAPAADVTGAEPRVPLSPMSEL